MIISFIKIDFTHGIGLFVITSIQVGSVMLLLTINCICRYYLIKTTKLLNNATRSEIISLISSDQLNNQEKKFYREMFEIESEEIYEHTLELKLIRNKINKVIF